MFEKQSPNFNDRPQDTQIISVIIHEDGARCVREVM